MNRLSKIAGTILGIVAVFLGCSIPARADAIVDPVEIVVESIFEYLPAFIIGSIVVAAAAGVIVFLIVRSKKKKKNK